MTDSVTVYTANVGGYDRLREQPTQDAPIDAWLCLTDDPVDQLPAPWLPMPLYQPRMTYKTARLASRHPKCLPPTATRFAVWIDALTEIKDVGFIRMCVDSAAASPCGVAAWEHPCRKDPYEEVAAIHQMGMTKYAMWNLDAQVASYRARGLPEKCGLYACATVAWDLANPLAQQFGEDWWAEQVRWGDMDQVSLPFVAHELGVKPAVFPMPELGNSMVFFMGGHLVND